MREPSNSPEGNRQSLIPSIGALLRHAREAARLSLKDLGEALDYWPSYLSDVERGQRGVPRELCDQLSRTLGLDRVELYARAGHLSDAVLDYLGQTPRALLVLERLAQRSASETEVDALLAWMDLRLTAEGVGNKDQGVGPGSGNSLLPTPYSSDHSLSAGPAGGHAGAGDPRRPLNSGS